MPENEYDVIHIKVTISQQDVFNRQDVAVPTLYIFDPHEHRPVLNKIMYIVLATSSS